MKIYILTCFLLLGFIYTQAQTKEETINWINEKVEKQNKAGGFYYRLFSEKYGSKKTKNIKFDIINGVLTLSYELDDSSDGINYKPVSLISYLMIPVYAIDSIYENASENTSNERLSDKWIELKLNKWLSKENNCTQRSTNYKNPALYSEWKTEKVEIPVNTELEENLLERFKKAITHLKTFYPKPTAKKEAF